MPEGELRLTRQLYVMNEQLRLARAPALAERRLNAFRARLRLEPVWEKTLQTYLDGMLEKLDLDGAILRAKTGWQQPATKSLWERLLKDDNQGGQYLPPSAEEVRQALRAAFNEEAFIAGGVQVYLGLALATGEEAGQHALHALGLDKTFAWANPRVMAQDLFAIRGSKIIQNLYGDHLDALTKLITEATDPRKPLTIQEVKKRIEAEWGDLRKYEIERIARTETASVWTTTSVNAYKANGVSKFESLIAQGPSIGENPVTGEILSEDPCDECVDAAAGGPFDITDDADMPPWHPQCRCEAIPVLWEEDGTPWLPPAEPWTGGTLEEDIPAIDPTDPTDSTVYDQYAAEEDTSKERLESLLKRARRGR